MLCTRTATSEKTRRILQHSWMNTGEYLNILWDRDKGINQGFKPFHDLISIVQHNSQFSDAVISCITACGFDVYNRVHGGLPPECLLLIKLGIITLQLKENYLINIIRFTLLTRSYPLKTTVLFS